MSSTAFAQGEQPDASANAETLSWDTVYLDAFLTTNLTLLAKDGKEQRPAMLVVQRVTKAPLVLESVTECHPSSPPTVHGRTGAWSSVSTDRSGPGTSRPVRTRLVATG